MGGGGYRWGDQAGWNVAGLGDITGTGYNVAAVGIPGWDSNPQTPVATGRDRGQAILLNGVVDPIAPTISITTPLDGAMVPVGTAIKAAFTCDDESTLVSCTATARGTAIASGANLPTTVTDVGPHVFSVTAKDAAGNTTIKTVTYNVVITQTSGPSGSVPATLSLSLATAPANLGSFVAGVAGTYNSTVQANVISTAAEALLSVT